MPTQKVFKHRVRERMSKTGESYTSARRQLIHKADGAAQPIEPTAPPKPEVIEAGVMLVADESMVSATGRTHAEWFAILDAWGATDHTHTEIARWLGDEQGVPPLVDPERDGRVRARPRDAGAAPDGRRLQRQRDADRRRGHGTGDRRIRGPGPSCFLAARCAAHAAPDDGRPHRRFDWTDPPSRVVVTVTAKGPGKTVVAVAHEKLPDAETGDRLKTAWRGWLTAMKTVLEDD